MRNNILYCYGVRRLLADELKAERIKTSGHKLDQQGKHYVELTNILFYANDDWIIDASEYENLVDGTWYEENYIPRITNQISRAVDKLTQDLDTRQATIVFYRDFDLYAKDPPCTTYVQLRLNFDLYNECFLDYTVHMRSSDVREYRSDVKFHKKLAQSIVDYLNRRSIPVKDYNIMWFANSLQCWDKDFEFLLK